MIKFLAVIKREYVQRVRTKFFVVATILGPVIMASFVVLPMLLASIQTGGPTRLAVIDERSLGAEGRWPWSRAKFATLIDALSRDGAKVIGFDVTFAESDDNAQLALIDRLARTVDSLAIANPQLSEFSLVSAFVRASLMVTW